MKFGCIFSTLKDNVNTSYRLIFPTSVLMF